MSNDGLGTDPQAGGFSLSGIAVGIDGVAGEGVGNPTELPLANLASIVGTANDKYLGAFKMPGSSTAYSTGTMAIVDGGATMFMVGLGGGGTTLYNIREFSVPTLVDEDVVVSNLNAATQLQSSPDLSLDFSEVISTYEHIGGMVYKEGTLYCNSYHGYDAGLVQYGLMFTVDGLSDLSTATVKGLMDSDVSPGKMAASLSLIPTEWQSIMGGDMLLSNGNANSITSRLSNGPSVFTLDSSVVDAANAGDVLTTGKFADFPLGDRLVDDFLNYGGATGGVNNDLWTENSAVGFTFIIPGTRTVCVIGHSSGHMLLGDNSLSYTTGASAEVIAELLITGASVNVSGIPGSNPYVGYDHGGNHAGTIFYKNSDTCFT